MWKAERMRFLDICDGYEIKHESRFWLEQQKGAITNQAGDTLREAGCRGKVRSSGLATLSNPGRTSGDIRVAPDM